MCALSLFYNAIALPFEDTKANIGLMIEETGTLVGMVLLVFMQLDYNREAMASAVIAVLSGVIMISMLVEWIFLVASLIKKRRERKRIRDYEQRETVQGATVTGMQINESAGDV